MLHCVVLKWLLIALAGSAIVAGVSILQDRQPWADQASAFGEPDFSMPTGRDPVVHYRTAWCASWLGSAASVIVTWAAVVAAVGLGRRRTGLALMAGAVAVALISFTANVLVGGLVIHRVTDTRIERTVSGNWQHREEDRFERMVGLGGVATAVVFAGANVVWLCAGPRPGRSVTGPILFLPR
jgi:hypothetical protein